MVVYIKDNRKFEGCICWTWRKYSMASKISVIMLTYNREVLVGRAIESILCQTMTDFEYIIVDNGSSDRSGQIAEEYAEKDYRIKVVHIPKSNIGTGRNTGLELATGEYITFIDDDDVAEPTMLEFLYTLAIENKAEISICGTDLKHFEEKLILDTEDALIKLLERKYYNVGFPTKLIHYKLFKQNRFPKEGRYDDIYLMPRIIAEAQTIAYWGKPQYKVTRHNNNNSAWTTNHELITPEILSEYLQVYHNRTIWLEQQFPANAHAWRYFEWSFMISMVDKISKNNLVFCQNQLEFLQKELSDHYDEFCGSSYTQEFEREFMRKYIV